MCRTPESGIASQDLLGAERSGRLCKAVLFLADRISNVVEKLSHIITITESLHFRSKPPSAKLDLVSINISTQQLFIILDSLILHRYEIPFQ